MDIGTEEYFAIFSISCRNSKFSLRLESLLRFYFRSLSLLIAGDFLHSVRSLERI